jgi:choline dehydrogenase-like flavoprotein
MRVNGANVFELVLAPACNWLGLALLAWAVAAVLVPDTLLPASTVAAGLLAGVAGAAGLSLVLGGGDVRRQRGALDLGLWLLGLVALALVIAGAIEGRAAAVAAGAVMLLARLLAGGLRREAVRGGYRPRWFWPRSFETMIATAETMLDADGREAIPPRRAAANTDGLLASIDAPIRFEIKLLFLAIEWVLPVVIFRPVPFSRLGPRARRQIVEKLIGTTGIFRSIPRTMKVLSCAGYYGDPATMRAIGFVEYEGSPRSVGKDLSAHSYGDPNPPREAAATGAAPATGGSPVRNGGRERTAVATGERFDAIVIGSGASGSVMAYELARRGYEVALVERGRHEDPQTFEHEELAMFPRLYKQGGLQIAADNNTAIFQGCTVGGSTVINNAIWLRPELDRVLPEWEQHGASVPEDRLIAAYEALEDALEVSLIDRSCANPGTSLFLHGAGANGELLKNNRHECLGCGWCNYGCRYNRKTSMLVTFIPWAIERGVRVLDRVQDVRIKHRNGSATGVEGTRAGERVDLGADKVILCAGAIGSSAVLLQSKTNPGGNVGANFHVLGGVFITGDMAQVVDGFAGIGLTCTADLGANYVLESYFAPPLAFSVRLGGYLLSHFDRAERYRHFIDGGVMVGTDPQHGKVSLSGGNAKIELTPRGDDIAYLKQGIERMADIYFKAGAERVYPSTFKYLDLTPANYRDVIDQQIKGIDDVLFGSAHPQGGNVMNRDPARGVVDEDFEVHGTKGLYVADTSVWPSNIRANCQATAMAMSHYAAERVTGEVLPWTPRPRVKP